MPSATATVQKSYIALRGLNLGVDFVRGNGLTPGERHAVVIEGIPDLEIDGKVYADGFLSGLSALYRHFDLEVGDQVGVDYIGTTIVLSPPQGKRSVPAVRKEHPADREVAERGQPVFERQSPKHIHIEPYAPGNLERWKPQTEPDIYMVFGALSEFTDYRYCCGTGTELLDRLGYAAGTKPDAILVDRSTGQCLMAESEMNSKAFKANHGPNDVDVLVCWIDDEEDRSTLPRTVLGLKALLEEALEGGNVDL